MDSYGTHKPVLDALFKAMDGEAPLAVIELGCGLFSTEIFSRWLAERPQMRLYSVESNLEWLNTTRASFPETDRHQYRVVGPSNSWSQVIDEILADIARAGCRVYLAFIDQSPWDARTISLFKLRWLSDYLVVHDVDYFPENALWGTVDRARVLFESGPIRVCQRNYSDVLRHWVEYLPRQMASVTGPPTLLGSMQRAIDLAVEDVVVTASSAGP